MGFLRDQFLAPLLFLLYINDLPNISKVLNFYLFADDTNIYYESNSLNELEKTVNKELSKLYLWLNVKALNEKECIKYLGVIIDSSLSWKHHILSLTKKISRSIGIMYKLRPFLPLKVMKNVYYSSIYSHNCLCN